jgi:hypothetical protein
MITECPTLFYEEIMKTAQEQAAKWLRTDIRYKFSVEVYCTKKHGNWVVSIKKGQHHCESMAKLK